MAEKSSNRTAKDVKIGELQGIIEKLRGTAAETEEENGEKREEVRKMRARVEQMLDVVIYSAAGTKSKVVQATYENLKITGHQIKVLD